MDWPIAAFGDVAFWLIQTNDLLVVSDWTGDGRIAEYAVPGSNRVVVQTMGNNRLRVDYAIELPTVDDLRALRALLQTEAVLRLPHGVSSAPATEVLYSGRPYDEISNVLLETISNVGIHSVEGWVRCTATFSRAFS